jgi:hypothetical protein
MQRLWLLGRAVEELPGWLTVRQESRNWEKERLTGETPYHAQVSRMIISTHTTPLECCYSQGESLVLDRTRESVPLFL